MNTKHPRQFDGPVLSQLLAGHVVKEVLKNNEVLIIKVENGDEIRVAWVDENGKPVKGTPAIAFYGRNIVPRVSRATAIVREAHGNALHKGPLIGLGS